MFNPVVLAITEKDLNTIVKPLLDVLKVLVPVLLGVKYAKAEEPQEHEKARASLKHAIIGFVLIFVLLVALQVGVGVFTSWYENYEFPQY